jgi:hypothetical protein
MAPLATTLALPLALGRAARAVLRGGLSIGARMRRATVARAEKRVFDGWFAYQDVIARAGAGPRQEATPGSLFSTHRVLELHRAIDGLCLVLAVAIEEHLLLGTRPLEARAHIAEARRHLREALGAMRLLPIIGPPLLEPRAGS